MFPPTRCFRAYKRFPWLLVSWLRTANLFVAQLPIDAGDILSTSWKVTDEKLTEAWQEVGTLICKFVGIMCQGNHFLYVGVYPILGYKMATQN